MEEFNVESLTFICQTLSLLLSYGNKLICELLILAEVLKPLEWNWGFFIFRAYIYLPTKNTDSVITKEE